MAGYKERLTGDLDRWIGAGLVDGAKRDAILDTVPDTRRLDAATAAKVKLIATETALKVSEQAIRIHGGAGIMREYAVGRIHRDAFVYVIGEGTSDIQRNIIARDLGFKP